MAFISHRHNNLNNSETKNTKYIPPFISPTTKCDQYGNGENKRNRGNREKKKRVRESESDRVRERMVILLLHINISIQKISLNCLLFNWSESRCSPHVLYYITKNVFIVVVFVVILFATTSWTVVVEENFQRWMNRTNRDNLLCAVASAVDSEAAGPSNSPLGR